jgi:hypothetical protein
MYLAATRKGQFKQRLSLNTYLIRYYIYLYKHRMFRTDWFEDELHSIYYLWQTAEERRRQILMCLMCF